MTARPDYMKRERKAQSYDKNKIFITRLGKKINLFDLIQESKDDSEITTCMKKYGCIEPLGVDYKKTYENYMEIRELRDIYDAKKRADELWDTLPTEVKDEFNGNANEFMNNGEQWLKDKIAKETAPVETPTQQPKGE